MTNSDGIDLLRKDHSQLAASVGALTQEMAAMKIQQAVRDERDKRFEENVDRVEKRFEENVERVEKSVDGLWSIGRWALFAFFGALIAGVVTFIIKGGLHVLPSP